MKYIAYLYNRFWNKTDQSNNSSPGNVIIENLIYKFLEFLSVGNTCKSINHAKMRHNMTDTY